MASICCCGSLVGSGWGGGPLNPFLDGVWNLEIKSENVQRSLSFAKFNAVGRLKSSSCVDCSITFCLLPFGDP
uniref:Uncharacterized protein n=1 Tax=Romanomermis culicivorax TaxID=13658 RepID=A0A915JM62_ROMCU